jgi:hypothetical protein
VANLVASGFDKRRESEPGVDFTVDDTSAVRSYGDHRVRPFGGEAHNE